MLHWPDYPLMFYPAVVVAVLLSGISKGGFGAGSGGLAVPIMSVFIAPQEAAGIMLPLLCGMDLFSVHAYRNSFSRTHLKALVPGALIGIAIGGLAFGSLPVNAIRLIIGVIAVSFALNKWLGLSERFARLLAPHADAPREPARTASGAFWGALSAFTSTLAHNGGPPFVVYILQQGLNKSLIVGTSAVFFLIVNYLKLIPYYFVGQLRPGNLATSLVFAPLVPLGIWLGVWLHRRVSERTFFGITYALLLASGVKLIADALTK